ncbi:MAG: WD40/YVTN/BNR-like repeat-containing protein [Gemmatimonadales bacterium]
MRSTFLVAAFMASVVAVHPSTAQPAGFDSTHFQGKSWRNIGPNRGGRSIAATGVRGRPNEYYFGAVGGGLWKTTDGGTSWGPVTDRQIRSSSVGAVAVAASRPDVVYIGMGETAFRGNIMQGDGVYKSTDGGKTWKHSGLERVQAISRIRVDPTNPDVVYVAAFGKPYAPSAERGVYRSRDGGTTWERVLFRNDSTAAVDLAIDPLSPQVLYASLWQAYRLPWKMSSGGAGSGLFKSIDGGTTWTELTRNPGMPSGVIGKVGVAPSGAVPNRVWAMVENDSGGVYRSDDGGATWRRTNGDRKLRQRAFYYSRIYADPKLGDRVYVLNTDMYRSDDGGVAFDSIIPAPHGDHHDLWIDPDNSERMINANDGGGTVSINAGKTWTSVLKSPLGWTSLAFPTAQAYRVAITKDFPYHVCGAQQDNSTFCLPNRGWDFLDVAAAQGDYFYEVGGGESGYIAPDPRQPNVFYAGSQGGYLTRYDRSTGELREIQPYPRFFSGEPASSLPERWQWTYPIVFSPRNPRILYTSSQHLFKSANEGQTWTKVSPDLTRGDPATLGLSGGPITHDMNGPEIYGTIFTVAPSFFDTLTIWTGSDDGVVQLTRDGGRTWRKVTPPGLPEFSRVSLIEASPHRPGTAYLAAKRYQLDDRAPYLYRTHDFGATWTKIVVGIREDAYVHVVREDPKRRGLLYAGTEHGVYLSPDDGDHWVSLSLNLPDVQVPDLVVAEHDLVIATHGRSMWVLDDIEWLRQYDPAILTAAAHLYTPKPAVRRVYPAVFHYTLRTPADTVRLAVLDSAGRVVREWIGTAATTDSAVKAQIKAAAQSDSLKGCVAGRVQPIVGPPVRAGLNQFTWDLTYPGPTVFDCMIIWSANPLAGPKAPPGRYAVRLVANGVTMTKPFVLRRDPRLKGATDADLHRQFALARSIRDRESAANEAVVKIRVLRHRVRDQAQRAGRPELGPLADRIAQQLTAIEEELYQVRNRSGQDPLNFPIKLNNRLAKLRDFLETGDARPPDGYYTVFRELSAELDRHLAALRGVEENEVRQLDERIRSGAERPRPLRR